MLKGLNVLDPCRGPCLELQLCVRRCIPTEVSTGGCSPVCPSRHCMSPDHKEFKALELNCRPVL